MIYTKLKVKEPTAINKKHLKLYEVLTYLDSGCAWQVQHCVSGRPGRSRFGNHESLLRRLQSLAQRLHLQTLPQQPEGGEKVSQ